MNTLLTTLAASGMVLGAAYALWLYRRLIFGTLDVTAIKSFSDLNAREVSVFVALSVMVFWLGLYPKTFLDIINPSVENLLNQSTALANKQQPGQTFAYTQGVRN